MESDPSLELEDLIKNLTYNIDQSFLNIQMNLGPTPSEEEIEQWKNNSLFPLPLFPPGTKGWKEPRVQEKIFKSQYHFDFGHCITLEVSALSRNNMKFPIDYENQKINLMAVHWNRDPLLNTVSGELNRYPIMFYLHNGTDIGLLDKDIAGDKVLGGYLQVLLQSFSFVMHK